MQVQPQVFRGEGIGLHCTHRLQRLHGDGIDGPPDTLLHRGPAGVAVGGVLGPGTAPLQPHRVVVKGGGRSDDSCVQCRGIGRQRLHGGAHLLFHGGVVGHQIPLLGVHGAHDGHHIAGIGVHDSDARLNHLSLFGGDIQVAAVRIDGLGDILDLRVHGGVDPVAAAVHQIQSRVLVDVVLLGQVLGHVQKHLVHKPVVDAAAARAGGGLGHQLVRLHRTVREVQRLRLDLVPLLLGEIGLAGIGVDDLLVGHPVQHPPLPLFVGLPGSSGGAVLSGDGDGGHGTVDLRVVGDGDDAGALRRGQIPHILAEVVLGRRLDAVAPLAQIDGIEVPGENLLLGGVLLKLQRPDDLPDLAVDGDLLVLGDIPQHLLGDGGRASGVPTRQEGLHCAQGPVPVHTVVLEEPVVLDGHRRLPHGLGNLVIGHQNPILDAVDGLVFHPLPRLLVLIVDKGAEVQLVIIHGHGQIGGHRGVDILQKDIGENSGGENADQRHCEQRKKHAANNPGRRAGRAAPPLPGTPLRMTAPPGRLRSLIVLQN